MSRDGHLIVSHYSCLKTTTNAKEMWDHIPEMKKRKSNYMIGPSYDKCWSDYSIPTLDLAEIKQLTRKQKRRWRSKVFDIMEKNGNMWEVVTLDEMIQFMIDMKENHVRDSGIQNPGLYIEVKDPIWYEETHQMDLTRETFEVLKRWGLETIEKSTAAGIPIIFQCFEIETLIVFKELSDLPLVFMMDWHVDNGQDYTDFQKISEVCHGVGPSVEWLYNWPY